MIYRGLILVALASPCVVAQDDTFEVLPPPPPLLDAVRQGVPIESPVTVVRRKDALLEEYRVNGRLHTVKVTPVVGPSYYLVDRDGDGSLETRTEELSRGRGPEWVLFRW